MSKVDITVYLVVGGLVCLMLVVDAGAPLWLAAPLSLATVLLGARPIPQHKSGSRL